MLVALAEERVLFPASSSHIERLTTTAIPAPGNLMPSKLPGLCTHFHKSILGHSQYKFIMAC